MKHNTPSSFLGTRQSRLVDEAFAFAKKAHRGQRRKYGGPYIAHPMRVARTVAKVAHTQEMVAAALLHDVVEDTEYRLSDIGSRFGLTVTRLVDGLTCRLTSQDGNRAKRKRIERERLAKAGPEVATVKLADVMDNCRDLVVQDPKFAAVYLAESKRLVEALECGDMSLRKRAREMVRTEQAKLAVYEDLLAPAVGVI